MAKETENKPAKTARKRSQRLARRPTRRRRKDRARRRPLRGAAREGGVSQIGERRKSAAAQALRHERGSGAYEGLRLQESDGGAEVEKVSLNVGLGEATGNSKLMDGAVNELAAISGQSRW